MLLVLLQSCDRFTSATRVKLVCIFYVCMDGE